MPVALMQIIQAAITESRRAVRAVGDYDLNTLLIRADPVNSTQAIEPGMTVWLRR
jgi:hypothetical protein